MASDNDESTARFWFENIVNDIYALSLPEYSVSDRVSYVEASEDFFQWTESLSKWSMWIFIPVPPQVVDSVLQFRDLLLNFYREGGEGYRESADLRWTAIMLRASDLLNEIESSSQFIPEWRPVQ